MTEQECFQLLMYCIEQDKERDAFIRRVFNRHRNFEIQYMRHLRRINRKKSKMI